VLEAAFGVLILVESPVTSNLTKNAPKHRDRLAGGALLQNFSAPRKTRPGRARRAVFLRVRFYRF
jgi:hypothetical protein